MKKIGRNVQKREITSKKQVNEGEIPQHIAIVMDGNGRWARQRKLPRTEGHIAGAKRVKEIARKCIETGVRYLTVYAFSKENWRRPKNEIDGIMKLTEFFFRREFKSLRDDGVFFVHLGDRNGLPRSVSKILDGIEKNNTERRVLTLSIAFNYSGRAEITRAFRELYNDVASGIIEPSMIDETHIRNYLYTRDIPDPDLLIRTGGEMRISNFLIWQVAYSEIWVTDVLWPDFSGETLQRAIDDYRTRERRFGGV
jgi:undecaprenyl diphosphate synthase